VTSSAAGWIVLSKSALTDEESLTDVLGKRTTNLGLYNRLSFLLSVHPILGIFVLSEG